MHVTLRARARLPSLRKQRVYSIFAAVVHAQRKRLYKDEFRVVHFSVQSNHVHLVIEADTAAARAKGYAAIRAGVSGLMIAFARRLNKLLHRKGDVWADRYHRHDLTSPRTVYNALRYVFGNAEHHGIDRGLQLDPCSSAAVFDGWEDGWEPPEILERLRWRWPVCAARTWLCKSGYLKIGRLPRTVASSALAVSA